MYQQLTIFSDFMFESSKHAPYVYISAEHFSFEYHFIWNLYDFLFDPISALTKCSTVLSYSLALLLWKTIYLRLFSIWFNIGKFIELLTICRFCWEKWKEFEKCQEGTCFKYNNGNEGFEGHPNGFKTNDLWHSAITPFI